jgi:hypothetical protein
MAYGATEAVLSALQLGAVALTGVPWALSQWLSLLARHRPTEAVFSLLDVGSHALTRVS